ncbi:Nn.00g087370.m01.CDS01 [Neocucurbitaria sp. VM-36]
MGRREGGEERGPPLAAKNNRHLLTNAPSYRLAPSFAAWEHPGGALRLAPPAGRPVTLALRSLDALPASDAAMR